MQKQTETLLDSLDSLSGSPAPALKAATAPIVQETPTTTTPTTQATGEGGGGSPAAETPDSRAPEPPVHPAATLSCIQEPTGVELRNARLQAANAEKKARVAARKARHAAVVACFEAESHIFEGKAYDVPQSALVAEFGGVDDLTILRILPDIRNRLCEGEFLKNPIGCNKVWLTEEGARRLRAEMGKGLMKIGDVVTMKVVWNKYPNHTLIRCEHGGKEFMVRVGRADHYRYTMGMMIPVKLAGKDNFVANGKPRQRGKF